MEQSTELDVDLRSMSKAALLARATELGIEGVSEMTKAKLLEVLGALPIEEEAPVVRRKLTLREQIEIRKQELDSAAG